MTDDAKLTRTKRQWSEQGRFLTGQSARPKEARLPPGQHLTDSWPVLDLGVQPDVPLESWQLRVFGAVQNALTLDWPAFQALPQAERTTDIHCVTTWSRYDNAWRGVLAQTLIEHAGPLDQARFAILHSYDGYTTNVPLSDFAAADVLLATHWQNQPLSRAHGGPVRLVLPHLYFWKSPKWLQRVEFSADDKPGYWEQNGYHMRGDPWAEQRYG